MLVIILNNRDNVVLYILIKLAGYPLDISSGYPANFIDSIVHRLLSKQFSNTDVMQPYGPRKRRVYLCLPYVGELATNKFARQITLH